LVLSSQAANQGLFLASLDDPQLNTRLVASTSNAAIGSGPDGRPHLLYLNDAGALVAQPFDGSLERLTGEPVVVAPESVRPGPSVRAAAFTASGRTLVYRPRFSPASRLVWFDRKGARTATVSPAGHSYRFPALSVDGTKLAAMRDDDFDTRGVWWLDLRHGVPERLTRGGELMSAWAPGGEQIIYSTPLPEGWTLHRRAIAGSDEAQLLLDGPVPVLKRVKDVTEDFLVFEGSDSDLWLLPLSGERAARRLMQTPEVENHARVSPNGRWLAYSSSDANETRVYVTAFPTPAERWLVSPAGGSDPHWRDDGRELYYVGPDDALMAVEVETDAKFSVGAQTPLFDARFDPQSRSFGSAYAPAPRGERFLVAELAQNAQAYLVVTQNWAPFEAGNSR
jgi:dipeptidyl aminopeptidase/acylaminoacyl peptidase